VPVGATVHDGGAVTEAEPDLFAEADGDADDCVLGLYGTPEMRTLSIKTEPELNVKGTNLTATPE